MAKIKYECEACGFIKKKEWTPLSLILKGFKIVVIIFFSVCALFGFMGFANFVFSGGIDFYGLTTFGGALSFVYNVMLDNIGAEENQALKIYAESITERCTTNYCRIKKLYYHLRDDLKYEEGTDLDPIKILNEQEGDCDEKAFTFLSLLRQLNISGRMQCYLIGKNGHCWAVVEDDGKRYYADLTGAEYPELEVIE